MKFSTLSTLVLTTAILLGACQNPLANQDPAAGMATRSAATSRLPSSTPPGGLQIEQVPMLVALGWDDNSRSEGIQWTLDMAAARSNPAGTGNSATFDGSPVRMSFFKTSYYISNWGAEPPPTIKKAWRNAWLAGHEIGNHTDAHPEGLGYSQAQWEYQIDLCKTWLTKPFDPNEATFTPDATKGPGIPADAIKGFRTPYLKYNTNVFPVLAARGLYDCSIEEGFQSSMDGTNFLWPYTLDQGSPGHEYWTTIPDSMHYNKPIGNYPGVWEMPVYAFIVPPQLRATIKAKAPGFDEVNGKITGLDYNLWSVYKMTKDEFLATLKYTFDLRLRGNRAPMLIGVHSDYYVPSYQTPSATYLERRQAIEEFLDYALRFSSTRAVSYSQVLDWVKNPVPLNTTVTMHTITATAGTNGSISPQGAVAVQDGQAKTFYFSPALGYEVDTILVNGVAQSPVAPSYTFARVTANATIDVSFKAIPGTLVRITHGPNGTCSPTGDVRITNGSLTINFTPATGYLVDNVTVDGVTKGPIPSLTLSNVQQSVILVHATFKATTPACALPVWNATSIYGSGVNEVHWNGADWKASWWTQGQEPGTTGEWGVWKKIRDCSANS